MDKDYSLSALSTFHQYAADKGLMKKETALSRKRAAEKILSILDPEEQADLRSVDLNQAFRRFETLKSSEFKPASLQVFQSRLKTAVTDFLSYVESPSAFKPSVASRSSAKNGSSKKEDSKNTSSPVKERTPSKQKVHQLVAPASENSLTIPIPLRPGVTVLMSNVPADLNAKEAEKLAAIIKAYAMHD